MKGRQIVLDTRVFPTPEGEETVEMAALIEDGRLMDLLVDHPAQVAPGTIYRAVADRPVKGQGGMFVTTPDGAAFLRQVKGIAPGDVMLVQVTGYPEPGKALPVTAKILFKSRYAIVTPGAPGMNISRSIKDDDLRDELQVLAHECFADHPVAARGAGLILRSVCAEADPEAVAEDIRAMADLAEQVLADEGAEAELLLDGPSAHDLALRDWEVGDVLDSAALPAKERQSAFELAEVLELAAPMWSGLSLPGGGRVFVEATRAAVCVDVNTGGDNSPAAGFKANLAAARELPRILRVRGLGGIIYLDLAPMGKKDRRQFESVLRAAFKSDPVDTVLAGWSPLGNYELQRKRARLPLDHFAESYADDLSDL
ncbi:Ribonuclease G [Pseudooceanicola marinus]|uniref:Ribonuclease G n=1 Tax=Pseudooceanicola marinus TaxID=396013 RepID=A0A1X6Y662_9RHOB|nr:ribonuclease E/G [Pseudooceanicola marinus]PJE33306.1 ribonuclease G [Pseudooceanicola marinus]SLN11699.1 Ribonuclease G [Pseudooceanicola marinus]